MTQSVFENAQDDFELEPLRPIAGDRLAGKVALVSGAGSAGKLLGTGAATSILFAAQGASVGVLDVDRARGNRTVKLIEQLGGRAMSVCADIRRRDECQRAVEQIGTAWGGLNVLINNAGLVRVGDFSVISDEDWKAATETMMSGTMFLSAAALPLLSRQGGAVVNVSSLAAIQGYGNIGYAAAKGAIAAMTIDMAQTAGPSGVRVNCIVPGYLVTPMAGGEDDFEYNERRRRLTYLGVRGSAWDFAWLALFLSSDESRYITAESILLDGGASRNTGLPEFNRFT